MRTETSTPTREVSARRRSAVRDDVEVALTTVVRINAVFFYRLLAGLTPPMLLGDAVRLSVGPCIGLYLCIRA